MNNCFICYFIAWVVGSSSSYPPPTQYSSNLAIYLVRNEQAMQDTVILCSNQYNETPLRAPFVYTGVAQQYF